MAQVSSRCVTAGWQLNRDPLYGQRMKPDDLNAGCKFLASAPAHWRCWFPLWQRLINRHCAHTSNKDAPFLHTERANVGVLAAAASQSGLTALEEFATRRGDGSREKSGRADLWVASQGERISEVFEAKRIYFGNEDSEARLTSVIADAVHQISAISESYYKTRGALVFCVVCATGKPGQDLSPESKQHLDRIRRCKADAFAWCFPPGLRRAPTDEKRSHVYHPGVVLLARLVGS